MHRALQIPEIVSLVSRCAGEDSLAALARTCRAFCEPALDLLWEEQDMLRNLLHCMPDGLWQCSNDEENEAEDENDEDDDEVLSLLRPIVPTDWDRVLFYSQRVKSFSFDMDADLRYHFSPTSVLDILRMSFPGPVLFPNLRRLEWSSISRPGTMHHIRLFLAPRLQELQLHTLHSPAELSLLPTIATQCPGLMEVDIDASPSLMKSVQNLYTFVIGLDQLRSLSVPRIDSSVLEHICRLPTLTSLNLTNHIPVTLPAIASDDLLFPTLHTLSMRVRSPHEILPIISLLIRAPLLGLKIDVPMWKDTAISFAALCKALGAHCTRAHSTLQSLSLRNPGVRLSGNVDPTLVVQNFHLRPLFLFTELTEVSLYPHFGFDLDDSMIDELARAWHRVKTLVLGQSRKVASGQASGSRITLAGLLSFAEHCPHLSFLELSFNASVVPESLTRKPPKIRVQQSSLTSLHVQISPCHDHQATAAFLSGAFPKLRNLRAETIASNDRVLAHSLIKKWKAVEELLPLLGKVRTEERIWAWDQNSQQEMLE
ncbi:hypothetical protein FB45DRAFT_1083102 [Roridomyces roridus]|uniref:F-box domain-containing protein n=1 Tax=Roridomyces roridus TaxID=1738132 RepID=A0AAD7AYB9_9AGAR|nr:hypothetical protein FB45DRAFT_1083102 [Roridomyces roridus]